MSKYISREQEQRYRKLIQHALIGERDFNTRIRLLQLIQGSDANLAFDALRNEHKWASASPHTLQMIDLIRQDVPPGYTRLPGEPA